MVVFGQKWLYSGKSGCNRAKVVVIRLGCCIRESGWIRAKVVVFGQSSCVRKEVVVFSGGCIRSKVVLFGQKWCYLGKVVVFWKSGCIWTKWLYSGKSFFIRAELLHSNKIQPLCPNTSTLARIQPLFPK